MTEDAEKRFERAMARLFPSKSTSVPPMLAASSAGAVVSPSQDKKGIQAQHGLEYGSRGTPVSRVGSIHSQARGSANVTALSSWSPSQSICRPWDRGDLLRRLSTFKSITWFGKPEVVGPINCARWGWINVDVDLIACEACNAQLSFPIPVSWLQHQAESAAEAFSERLDTGHKALCPWRGNACSETLAQFPRTPVQALIEGYKDRCDLLLRLSALPVVAKSAIDYLKLSRGPQIDSLLAKAFPNTPGIPQGVEDGDGSAAACSVVVVNGYHQSQILISLCGWKPRFLPYIVDCENDSTHSARGKYVEQSEYHVHKDCELGPSVFLRSRVETMKGRGPTADRISDPAVEFDPASAVLDCDFCGASVGLWKFSTVTRPSPWINSPLMEPAIDVKNAVETPACGVSAASGVEHTCSDVGKEQEGQPDEAGEAITSVPKKRNCVAGVLDLNLTIAGGPPPTQLSSRGLIPLLFPSAPLNHGISYPERSEMGDWLGSAEYQEQRTMAGQVSSNTEERRQKAFKPDNGIYGNTGCVNADVADTEVGKGQGGVADLSKLVNTADLSETAALRKPANNQYEEKEFGESKHKRKRDEHCGHDISENKHFVEHCYLEHPRYSSVDAVDTCYHSRQENSMESVEMPQDVDSQATAVSVENNDAEVHTLQAQQSTCGEVFSNQRAIAGFGLSRSDEGGNETNVAAIGTGSDKEHGFSVGMGSAKFDTSGSQDTSVYRSRMSVLHVESGVDEVDDVAEVTENLGQITEVVRRREKSGLVAFKDGYQEAQLSTYSEQKGTSVKGTACMEGESGESRGKDAQEMGADPMSAVDAQTKIYDPIVTNEKRVLKTEVMVTCLEPIKLDVSPTGACAGLTVDADKLPESKKLWDTESKEFDPIRQHRHFCPWVNVNAAMVGFGNITPGGACCVWELALDGLSNAAIATESESASSQYNVHPLASVRKILGSGSHSKRSQKNSNCG
eukprot:c27001_g1_i1 orf=128-3028(+)